MTCLFWVKDKTNCTCDGLDVLDSPLNLKRNVFPEPLLEISKLNNSKYCIDDLKKDENIVSLLPFGSRYHLILKSQNSLGNFLNKYEGSFLIKKIEPNLEDVFVRLVEGDR